jgi:hypothetical protein
LEDFDMGMFDGTYDDGGLMDYTGFNDWPTGGGEPADPQAAADPNSNSPDPNKKLMGAALSALTGGVLGVSGLSGGAAADGAAEAADGAGSAAMADGAAGAGAAGGGTLGAVGNAIGGPAGGLMSGQSLGTVASNTFHDALAPYKQSFNDVGNVFSSDPQKSGAAMADLIKKNKDGKQTYDKAPDESKPQQLPDPMAAYYNNKQF